MPKDYWKSSYPKIYDFLYGFGSTQYGQDAKGLNPQALPECRKAFSRCCGNSYGIGRYGQKVRYGFFHQRNMVEKLRSFAFNGDSHMGDGHTVHVF